MRSKKPKLQSKQQQNLQRGIERMERYAEQSREHFEKMVAVGMTIETSFTGPLAGRIK